MESLFDHQSLVNVHVQVLLLHTVTYICRIYMNDINVVQYLNMSVIAGDYVHVWLYYVITS